MVLTKLPSAPLLLICKIIFDGQVDDHTSRNDYSGYNQNIGIADLDGDGQKDIVSTYDCCYIGIMERNGTEFSANSMFKGGGHFRTEDSEGTD